MTTTKKNVFLLRRVLVIARSGWQGLKRKKEGPHLCLGQFINKSDVVRSFGYSFR